MSFQEEWVLPEPVENYSSEHLLAIVRSLLPEGPVVTISGLHRCRTLRVDFPVHAVDRIAAKLSKRPGELDWDWHDDMDPPREGRMKYDVHIDVVDDERPIVRIYSNDGQNREAWPIVLSIASSLATELGAIPEEDAPPPSDRFPLFIEPGKRSLLN